jgi:hypothetical protein
MFPTAQVATARRLNPFGLIGFVLAIVAFIIGFFPILTWPMWIQVVVWIIWAGALALSIIGLFKVPRGFAIAGVIIAILCMATTSFTVATSGF